MNDTVNMGNRIAELRKAAGLTQEQLASKLSISAQAVSKWETGASFPDISILPELCAILGVTTDELLGTAPLKNGKEEQARETAKPRRPFDKGALFFGLMVLLVGLVFLLDRTRLLPLPQGISVWELVWPAVLMGVALSLTLKHFSLFWLALAFFGLYMLLLNLRVITAFLTWGVVWPVLLVLLGLSIAYSALFGKSRFHVESDCHGQKKKTYEAKDGYVKLSCAFCGMDEQPSGDAFMGGDISVSFGEGVLDLTGFRSFSPGAVLKADCAFGSLKITLPRDIKADLNVSRSFASVEEINRFSPEIAGGALRIVGGVSFGSLEVSYR